jgi:hypothetical protein
LLSSVPYVFIQTTNKIVKKMVVAFMVALVSPCAHATVTKVQESRAATGWVHERADGVVHYAALGLFKGSTVMSMSVAEVKKHPNNPLFDQDKPWEPRLDNGYPVHFRISILHNLLYIYITCCFCTRTSFMIPLLPKTKTHGSFGTVDVVPPILVPTNSCFMQTAPTEFHGRSRT